MIRKTAWLLSAGLAALATPALGQTTQSTTDTDKGSAQPTQSATEGAAVQDQARERQPVDTGDIIVTATRRNEALSDVPMAVSAVTAQTLENTGATDIRQLNQVAPSLLVSSTSSEGGAAVARIRGSERSATMPGSKARSECSSTACIVRVLASLSPSLVRSIESRCCAVRRAHCSAATRRRASSRSSPPSRASSRRSAVRSMSAITTCAGSKRSLTGPLSETIAARIDGVWLKRDGFLKDVISGRRVNDRDRWMLRGQMLFQPSDDLSVRLIADYSKRNEECCAAPYLPARDVVATGGGGTAEQPSTIAAIERALGGIIRDDTFDRRVSITPGRSYRSDVKDGGVSAEIVYDFGGAELTSISAYRTNKYTRGQDADFNNLDILFRDDDGGAFNRFKTFTQELRLQGNAFNNRLDWLVGGYYANEKLAVDDNLAYGADYARYGNCLVAANFVAGGSPASLLAPGASPTCFNPAVAPLVQAGLTQQFNAAVAGGNIPLATAIAGNITALSAFARLNNIGFPGSQVGLQRSAIWQQRLFEPDQSHCSTLNGASIDDSYRQTSNNWAVFTHNIFSITDRLKLTLGARYTHETEEAERRPQRQQYHLHASVGHRPADAAVRESRAYRAEASTFPITAAKARSRERRSSATSRQTVC